MQMLDKILYNDVEFVIGETRLLAKVGGDSSGSYYPAIFQGIEWTKERSQMYTESRIRLRYTSQVTRLRLLSLS